MNAKTTRWWDIPAAFFLVAALMSAAVRLHVTNWTDNLSRVEVVVLLGAAVGLALGKSLFRDRTTFWLGLAYSTFAIPWQLGLLMPEGEWLNRLNILYARLYWAIFDFIRNQPVKDPILFITTMVILYWFASLLASYGLVRRANPWIPLIALGGMILVVEYTVELYRYVTVSGGTYSFLYLVFCLMLMGRLYFIRSRREWEQRGGTVELEVGYDLGRGVLVSALVLALIAWNAPRVINVFASDNPAKERISRTFQEFRDRITKATNSLKSPSPMVVEGYGTNMFLGTGGPLGDEVVFTVHPERGGRPDSRVYWAARSYDTYVGNGQWVSSLSESIAMGLTKPPVKYPKFDLRKEIPFTFNSRISLLQTLYYPNDPVRINRDVKAIVSQNDNEETDLGALVMDPPLKAGEAYTVTANVGFPTVNAMREAGTEYPQWVTDRYLELPENFSPRIAELAKQVAGNEKTPYDQVIAVTQYLRRTITYSESIPQVPAGREPLEWFLFDHRAGFCNYYASSEVLMLRSLGIPARMVAGYAQGNWDNNEFTFTVIGKDSHAWPEVFFPNLGWVIFEPTVSQPMVSFPIGEDDGAFDDAPVGNTDPSTIIPTQDPMAFIRAEEQLNAEDSQRSPFANISISPWVVALLLLVLLVGAAVYFEWNRRRKSSLPLPSWLERLLDERGFRTPAWLRLWSQQALRTPMENLFANVGIMLRIWGQPVEGSQTPSEQVTLLVGMVPALQDSAGALLEEYQRAMYSPYPPDVSKAKRAVDDLRNVGLRNWVLRLAGLETA